MTKKQAVIGIVGSVTHAERVVAALEAAGFQPCDISALLPDKSGARDFAHEQNTKAPEGAVAGVSAGGAIGGTLGLLVGIGALAIPGLGPFIAAGPIMAALSGAAAGAAVGGVTGALIGMGIPEIEARQYEGKLRTGNILLSVHVENSNERNRARAVMERHAAENITTAPEKEVPSSQAAPLPSPPRAE